MQNKTRENIRRKRKAIRKRRRIAVFRWLFFIIVIFTILSFVIFVSYKIYEGATYLYNEYITLQANYAARKENSGVKTEKLEGYTNILLLGIDDGASIDNAEGLHADSIFFVSMALDTGRLRIIEIPSDTYISCSEGEGRIANFYDKGGSPRMVRAISEYLNVSIHQYVTVNTNAFAELVDALGGIDIYVEDNMNYDDEYGNVSIHLEKGYQHLNGTETLNFLRYRNTALSDMGRLKRQEKFVKTLYQKLLQLDTVSKIPKVAEIFKTDVDTSAEIFDSGHIATMLRKLSSDPPIIITLPGFYEKTDMRYWNPNQEEITEKMREFFPDVNEVER